MSMITQAFGASGLKVSTGRAVAPVMIRTHSASSVNVRITRASDGSVEERESGSRYGWSEEKRPLRIDYEIVDGEEIVRSWSYIEPWEMP